MDPMENKMNVIIGLGVLVLLLPFLGLPQSLDNFLYVISGLALVIIAVLMKLNLKNGDSSKPTRTFEENGMYRKDQDDR